MRHENHNAASPDRASLHPNSPEKIAKKHDFMLDDGRFLMKKSLLSGKFLLKVAQTQAGCGFAGFLRFGRFQTRWV
jgi:hypothetical protein